MALVELPKPKLRHFSALIRVKAAGVNPVDYKVRQGMFDGMMDAYFPVVPGWDVAGVVESVHYTSNEFTPGDEVIGYAWMDCLHHGSYAEYLCAPVRSLARKPRNMTWEQAAGLPLAGLTAYRALKAIDVRRGATLLVHAAAGGVGSLGVQIAKILGARVIGTASAGNHEFLRGLGVEPVAYGAGLAERVRALAPDGVDGVVDFFGAGSLEASMSLLAEGVGVQQMVTVADRAHADEIGARWTCVQPDAGDLSQLVAWAEQGALTVHVSEVRPLADAVEVHRRMQREHGRGKTVLSVG